MTDASEITSAHCRAARGLLNWTQDDLARQAGISRRAVLMFESNEGGSRTAAAIRDAFVRNGIEFTNGDAPGVRLRA